MLSRPDRAIEVKKAGRAVDGYRMKTNMAGMRIDPVSVNLQRIEEAAVRTLVNNMLTALHNHYPRYDGAWNIVVDTREKGGVAQVRNLMISGKMGFQLPIAMIDSEMRVIVRMAGELLERYRLSRERNVDVVDQINNLERSPIGEAKYDA